MCIRDRHSILKNKKMNTMVQLLLSAIVITLFRKNGIYIVIISFVFLLFIYKTDWKKWGLCIGIIILIQVSWNNLILPICGVSQGSIREALSIPFQQTARYVKTYGDEVTIEMCIRDSNNASAWKKKIVDLFCDNTWFYKKRCV